MTDTQTPTETPETDVPAGNTPAPTDVSVSDVTKLIDAIKSSQRVSGDDSKALEVFAGQIIAKDKRINELKAQVGQLPSDVQTELTTYRELGKPDELKTRLERESTLTAEKQQREKADAMSKAVSAAGFDPDKFAALKGTDELSYEVKTEGEGDSKKTVAYATFKDGDKDVTKPLSDLVAERWPSLADSLKAQANGTQNGRAAAPKMGVNGGGVGNEFDEIRKKREALNKQQAESTNWMEQAGVARTQ